MLQTNGDSYIAVTDTADKSYNVPVITNFTHTCTRTQTHTGGNITPVFNTACTFIYLMNTVEFLIMNKSTASGLKAFFNTKPSPTLTFVHFHDIIGH